MPTLNQLTNLDFATNIVTNGLDVPDKSKAVYDLSGDYNALDFLISRLSIGAGRQITGRDGIIYKPIIGRSSASVEIASATLSGNVLTVNFVDPLFVSFRYKEVIGDGTAAMNMGRIIQKGPGYVVLEAMPGVTFSTATMFVAGATAVVLFPISGVRGSTGMESLYEEPTYVSNRTSITRDSLILYRRDMMETYVKYHGDNWSLAQQPMMMKRFARNLEKKAYWSRQGVVTNSTQEGTVAYSMGIREAILDPQRGGEYLPGTGALTQSIFEGWIAKIADRTNKSKYTAKIGCGRGFLQQVQSIYGNYIQYAGTENTFGGQSVTGIDFYKLAFNGIEVDLLMIPFFNDREQFPQRSSISSLGNFTRMQYTAIVLDDGYYTSADGIMLPAMEKVYFGDNEIEYGYIPGMVGSKLGGSTMYQQGNLRLAATDKDACSIEIYTDSCYDVMAYRMGLYELIV